MNLLNLFRRPRKIVLIRRFSSRLRLEEWRGEPPLVHTGKKFLTDPEFAVIVDVLKNESPSNMMLFRSSIEDRALQQARIEGYEMAISNLESMGTPASKTTALPEPSFEQPDEES